MSEKSDELELVTISFGTSAGASEALAALKAAQAGQQIAVLNTAVIDKDAAGRAQVREREDIDSRRGALFGAITGSIIGLIGGPLGALVGAAAGAASGAGAAHLIDFGFPDTYLDTVKQVLAPASSALVVLVERAHAEALLRLLDPLDGIIQRQAINDDMVRLLDGDDPAAAPKSA